MGKYEEIAAEAARESFDGVILAFAIFALPLGAAGEWRVAEEKEPGEDYVRTVYHWGRPVVRARSNGGSLAWVTRAWVSEEMAVLRKSR